MKVIFNIVIRLYNVYMMRFISIIIICFLTSAPTVHAGTFNGLVGISVGYDDNTSLSPEENGSSFMSYHSKLGFRFLSDKYPAWETDIFTDGIYREYLDSESNEDNYRLRIGGYSTWAIAGGRLMPGIFGHASIYRDALNPSDEKDGFMIGVKLDWLASARMTMRIQHTRQWLSYKNPYTYPETPIGIVQSRRSYRRAAGTVSKPLHSNFSQTDIGIPMPSVIIAETENRFLRYGYGDFSLAGDDFPILFSKFYVPDDNMFIPEYPDFSFDENNIYRYSGFSIIDEYLTFSESYTFSFSEKGIPKTGYCISRIEKGVQQPSWVLSTAGGNLPPGDYGGIGGTTAPTDSDSGNIIPPSGDSVSSSADEKLDESIRSFGVRWMIYLFSYLQSEISAEYIRSDFSVDYESYTGKTAAFSLIWTPNTDWEISPAAYWKRFDYDNTPDRVGRQITERGIGLNISRFFKSFEVFARIDLSDHHSDFEIETYHRTISQCGIVWSF